MKRKLLEPALLAFLLGGAAAQGQVINFHNAYNFANYNNDSSAPLYGSIVYSGQGVYSDPGHNVWNGFGGGAVDGFPGEGFDPSTGNLNSDGSSSPVSLTLSYSGDNTGLFNSDNTYQGTPQFLLGTAALVSTGLGSFTLNNVAQGTYDLFLYGANYDYTRGAAFNITEGGGTAVGGFTSTLNGTLGGTQGGGFIIGDNYVEFTGVTVGVDGTISGTWGAVSNPNSSLSGEGDFNGLQLVASPVPEPTTLALAGLGIAGLLAARRRK